MKDIEALKMKHAQELEYAELENKLEAILHNEAVAVAVIGKSYTQKGKYHVHLDRRNIGEVIGMREAKDILNTFPTTQDIEITVGRDRKELLPYRLDLHRYPTEWRTRLSIEWVWEDYDISFDMMVDEGDDDIMQFLGRAHRTLTDSEVSAYGIQRSSQRDFIHNFNYWSWCRGSICHISGGTDRQTSRGHITSIVETIKWKSFDDVE